MRKQRTTLLRRYTNLPSLFDILENKRITLLDPSTWDDKNDSYFLHQYKVKKQLKTILGLCFTEKGETYHHWKVFSDGSSGVCVVFKKDALLKKILICEGVKEGLVEYKRIKQLKNIPPSLDEMPFVKRLPYRDEKEYRLIYENKIKKESFKHIDIDIGCIDRITLSPWTPEPLIEPVRKAIKNIHNVKVYKSSLISNEQWKVIGESVK